MSLKEQITDDMKAAMRAKEAASWDYSSCRQQ
jgi:uncharacterized protein YqeY